METIIHLLIFIAFLLYFGIGFISVLIIETKKKINSFSRIILMVFLPVAIFAHIINGYNAYRETKKITNTEL